MATNTNAELYQLAFDDAGRSTTKELAKSVDMKEPNFLAAITKHAMESKKPLPKMAFEKSKTTVKRINRRRIDCDIRISHHRLANAGMSDVLSFKLIAEEGGLRLVPDTSAPKAAQGGTIQQRVTREKAAIDQQIEEALPVRRTRGKAKPKEIVQPVVEPARGRRACTKQQVEVPVSSKNIPKKGALVTK